MTEYTYDPNYPTAMNRELFTPEELKIKEAFFFEDELEYDEIYHNKFSKIGEDEDEVKVGDSKIKIETPLYYNQKLFETNYVREPLIQMLEELSALRNDVRVDEGATIVDIIDPDLDPNYWFNPNETASERMKYSWFPLNLVVYPDEITKTCLMGEIRGLDPIDNQRLYEFLFCVWNELVPGFHEINVVNEYKFTKLQVVVRVQKVIVPPKSTFPSKWEVEGKTENIIAGAIYYLKVDKGFEKDYIVFRQDKGPDPSYQDKIRCEYVLPIYTDSAIVFSNRLPHKVLDLKNPTEKPLERLMLYFYVVDPTKRLTSTCVYTTIKTSLRLKFGSNYRVVDHIISFLYCKNSMLDAMSRRDKARAEMKNEKTGWGFYRNGNIGEVEFLQWDFIQKDFKKNNKQYTKIDERIKSELNLE